MRRLEENVRAASINLTAENLKESNQAISNIKVQGARYSEQEQKIFNCQTKKMEPTFLQH